MSFLQTDPKIRLSLGELNNTISEAGLLNSSHQFNSAVTEFENTITRPLLVFDLYYFSTPTKEFATKVSGWLTSESFEFSNSPFSREVQNNGIGYLLRLSPFEVVSSNMLGKIQSPLNVILISESDRKSEDLNDKLLAVAGEKSYLLIIAEGDYKLPNEIKRELDQSVLNLEFITTERMPEKKLFERLGEPDFFNLMNILHNYNCLGTIDSFNNIFGLMLEQEDRSLKAKKALNQQQVVKIQTKSSFSGNEALMTIKNNLSNQLSMIEKGINDSFENVLRPVTGVYSIMVEEEVNKLVTLEESKQTKTMALTLTKEFEKNFYDRIYNAFLKYGQEHMITLRDSFKTIERDLDRYCDTNGLPQFTLNFKYLTEQQLRVILDSAVRADRPYEGAVPKKGAYEYFMAMRKYQMVAVMIMSTIGFSWIRQIRSVMIPMTVVLLGIGGYNVYKTVQEEGAENEEKEIDKAKESLRNETKRIAAEVSRQWMRVISDHIKNQMLQNISTIESSVKDFSSKKSTEDDEEKKRVQRQVQGLDSYERKMTNVYRLRDTFYRNLQKYRLDFRQAFVLAVKKVAY